MDAKLTLKLDKLVIERAKKYAASHKKSLSRLIESYLKALTDRDQNNDYQEIELSDFVKSMRTGVKIPSNISLKDQYTSYLEEKYK